MELVTSGAPAIVGAAGILHIHDVGIPDPLGIRLDSADSLCVTGSHFGYAEPERPMTRRERRRLKRLAKRKPI